MKKILLDYANTFAYTVIGLVFGLAFFLLFINFYHMQELDTRVDVVSYNANNKTQVEEKIAIIKNNISVLKIIITIIKFNIPCPRNDIVYTKKH